MSNEHADASLVQMAICGGDAAAREEHAMLVRVLGAAQGVDFSVRTHASAEGLLADMARRGGIPDVILLDVTDGNPSGIEAARKLRRWGFAGAIVFVTVSPDFVFDSSDVGAFDYVLRDGKEDPVRFAAVLAAAVAHIQRRHHKYILVKSAAEHLSIAIDSIAYIESRRHICIAHYGQGQACEFVSSLQKVEEALRPHRFVRIHRSFLVNCAFVERFNFRSCILRDGTELPVGRQRYQELRRAMEAGATGRF